MNKLFEKNKSLQSFECYRAFAVSAVMIGHFFSTQSAPVPFWLKFIGELPIEYGVPVFFLISGYLLAASFQSVYSKSSSIASAYVAFIKKRIYRIYPAYIVALGVLYLLSGYDRMNMLLHIFNIHNFSKEYSQSISPAFWSLAVEFQWYLIAPFVILAVLHHRIFVCMITIMIFFSGSLLIFNYLALLFLHQQIDLSGFVWLGNDQLFIHLYAFALGALLFRIRNTEVSIPRNIIIFLWVYFIVIKCFNLYWIPKVLSHREVFSLFAVINFRYVSQIGLAIMLFHYRSIDIKSPMISSLISYIAAVSYGLYIWHLPIVSYLNSLNISVFFRFFCYIVCTYTIASASYFLIEKYFLLIGKEKLNPRAIKKEQYAG
jgi:peptidoglycan/LPS O-acetylase OafA/YrhL